MAFKQPRCASKTLLKLLVFIIVGFVLAKKIIETQYAPVSVDRVKTVDSHALIMNPDIKEAKVKTTKGGSIWNAIAAEDLKMKADDKVSVMMPLVNAKANQQLERNFQRCVSSISQFSSVEVVLFVVGDEDSHTIAENIVNSLVKKNIKMVRVSIEAIGSKLRGVVEALQTIFSPRDGSYYSQTLFFLSVGLHLWAPPSLHRLIMLDADLQFRSDIRDLDRLFSDFAPSQLVGIAFENQPVYRHVLSIYRQAHPGTRAGDPPRTGFPGFNSGVLLLNLDRLRQSQLFGSLLTREAVAGMSKKYSYVGHLGDQDFYTLAGLEHPQLFYTLPCGWNRQLCIWWRDNGYGDVFDEYFACNGTVHVYHGNCNTPLPVAE